MPTSLKQAESGFALYLALFAAAWRAYVLLVYLHIRSLGEKSLAYAAANVGIRMAIWVLPACLMLRFFDGSEPLRALGLVANWRRGVLAGFGLSCVLFAFAFLRHGWPHDPGNNLTWNSVLSTSLGIGFFEEIPFRGFILQKLQTTMNFWLANTLASLVFVLFHLPGWLMLHLFTPLLGLNIFLFAFIMGALFRYSRSLWSCIIVHDANDFISAVLFHS